jgi:hypothetical protein
VRTRELTDAERKIVTFMLSEPFLGRDELIPQAETVRSTGASCACGCPSFGLAPDRSFAPANVPDRVPVSASGRDPGGNLVGVLLFVDDGYMTELEIFSPGGESTFAGLPDPRELTIDEWSEPAPGGTRYLLNPPEGWDKA